MNRWQKDTKPVPGGISWLEEVFTYHAPSEEQKIAYNEIRVAAKKFATILLQHTPYCADQNAALRLLRECVMTANAAVALEGLV